MLRLLLKGGMGPGDLGSAPRPGPRREWEGAGWDERSRAGILQITRRSRAQAETSPSTCECRCVPLGRTGTETISLHRGEPVSVPKVVIFQVSGTVILTRNGLNYKYSYLDVKCAKKHFVNMQAIFLFVPFQPTCLKQCFLFSRGLLLSGVFDWR